MAISSSNFAVILILSVLFFLVNNPLKCEAGNVLYNVGAMYPVEFLNHNTTQLILTEHCDLVMPNWQTHTSAAFCNLTLENNGELVLYGGLGQRLWASTVSGASSGDYVLVQNTEELAVYGPSKWATNTALETLSRTDLDIRAENVLFPEHTLESGKSLKNGRWELRMLRNCNLVLYDLSGKKGIWSSNTSQGSKVACHLKMESTGDAVIYNDESGDQVWSSDTSGIGSSVLVLRNDGNLVIYGPAIWNNLVLLKKDRKQSALGRPFIKMV